MHQLRQIAHLDINHCYAQIIEMLYPELRKVPMAVGGHEELRHGIILARNLKAKAYGIKTAETLREARAKCPGLVIVPPKYELFIYYTEKVKDIYREYTDQVESFGLDEAWLDLTASQSLFGSAVDIASTIQARVLNEIGLTVSVGLSYNKVFAKLASDLVKPAGFVVITKANFLTIIGDLAVDQLLFVGRKTAEKLARVKIFTIRDLALKPKGYLKDLLGKNGELIWYFANGYDTSEVLLNRLSAPVKSIGNSITTPADINNLVEAKIVFQVLAESVAARLKTAGLVGSLVTIYLRNVKLHSISRQQIIVQPTNLAQELMATIIGLLKRHYDFTLPLRSIGVSVSKLSPELKHIQLNLFQTEKTRQKQVKLEKCLEQVRQKYGFKAISNLAVQLNPLLTDFNPKDDHVIHPISWF